MWDAESYELKARLEGHLGAVTCVAICPMNDNLIATGGEDQTVRLWSLRDLTVDTANRSRNEANGYNLAHHILKGHSETVWTLQFSSDGRLLASGASDCSVRIWNASAKQPTLNSHFRAHESWIRCLYWTDDRQLLATASTDGLVSLWQVPKKYHRHPAVKGGKQPKDETAE